MGGVGQRIGDLRPGTWRARSSSISRWSTRPPEPRRHRRGKTGVTMSTTKALWEALRCPDDGSRLRLADAPTCQTCGREFQRVGPHAVDLVSSALRPRPAGVSDRYWSEYQACRRQPLVSSGSGVGWGAAWTVPPEWAQLRQAYSRRVLALVCEALGPRVGVVADISAGAGYVTHLLARENIGTLHVDLDPTSVAGAAAWLDGPGAGSPMIAVRGDYFALPLRGSVDVVVCTDTLIRSREHELAVLTAIKAALKPDGTAIVDFHNWMHNPLRRVGLLRNNFAGNRSYLRHEIGRMLHEVGLRAHSVLSYRQEEDRGGWQRLLAPVVPPTRFLAVLRRT